jgi:hypothetical protein
MRVVQTESAHDADDHVAESMMHQQSTTNCATEVAVRPKKTTNASPAVGDIFNGFYAFGQNNPQTSFI